MGDIRFNCPGCEQVLEAPPEMAGDAVECPSCGQTMTVPSPEPAPAAPAAAAPAESASNACPECGAAMPEAAVLCVQCGFHLKLGKKLDTDLS